MFRMRSRLGIISALLLLTTQCFAFKCRTCNGEECQKEDVEMRECTKFSTLLPSEEAYPLLSKLRENLLYACLKLEYHYGNSTRMLEKCIITENVNTFCENVAKSIPYTQCDVSPSPSARLPNDTNVQLRAKIILNNDKSDLKHKIRLNIKYYAKDRVVTPKPNSDTTFELIKSSVNPLATTTTTTTTANDGDWEDNTGKTMPELVASESELNSEENQFTTASKINDNYANMQKSTEYESISYSSGTTDSTPNTVSELTYETGSASEAFPENVETEDAYITSTTEFTVTENVMATETSTTNFDDEISSQSTSNSDVGHTAENISYQTTTTTTKEFDQRTDENDPASNVANDITTNGEFETSSSPVESGFDSTTNTGSTMSDEFLNKTPRNNEVSNETNVAGEQEQGADDTELPDNKDHPSNSDDFSEHSTENHSFNDFTPDVNENSYSGPATTISELIIFDEENPNSVSPTLISTDEMDCEKTDASDEILVKNHTQLSDEFSNVTISATGLTADLNESQSSPSSHSTTMSGLGTIIDAAVVPPNELDIEKIGAEITVPSEVTDASRGHSNENDIDFSADLNEGENSPSSAYTTMANVGITSIVIIEAENPSSVSSTMVPPSELNFGPTNPAKENEANQTEPSEEYASSLDEVIDASLGYKVEFSFILCMTSFAIYLVL